MTDAVGKRNRHLTSDVESVKHRNRKEPAKTIPIVKYDSRTGGAEEVGTTLLEGGVFIVTRGVAQVISNLITSPSSTLNTTTQADYLFHHKFAEAVATGVDFGVRYGGMLRPYPVSLGTSTPYGARSFIDSQCPELVPILPHFTAKMLDLGLTASHQNVRYIKTVTTGAYTVSMGKVGYDPSTQRLILGSLDVPLLQLCTRKTHGGVGSVFTTAHSFLGVCRDAQDLLRQRRRERRGGGKTSGHLISAAFCYDAHLLWYLAEVTFNVLTKRLPYKVPSDDPTGAFHSLVEYANAIDDLETQSTYPLPPYVGARIAFLRSFIRWLSRDAIEPKVRAELLDNIA